MSSTSKNEFDLLEEHGEDQLLLQALEESIRFYEEVEAPRAKQSLHKADLESNEPGCSKQDELRQDHSSAMKSLEIPTQYGYSGLDENGFDRYSGRSWIYPINYPVRDYQFNIVECSLYKNTLVSLPTGLGKTFIAAVVMYNFYRWFPEGKILFMAPTRPLVAQQIESCYKVMGIPKHDTAEMTGQMPPHQREVQWKKCRLFFLTPQSLMSDLMRSTCPVQQIRCVVVDEAHRATGNYAYCQVIQAILPFNKFFRVLALSATPGNDMDAVQQVVKNLLIEQVEVRDELSADTAQYTNERIVDTVVVKLEGFHKYIYDVYANILGSYMDLLLKHKIIYSNPRNTSKYSLIMSRNKFRSNPPSGMPQSVMRQIEYDFALCMTLAHGLELLCQHGLRNLYRYLKNILEDRDGSNSVFKARLSCNGKLTELLEVLKERLGETDLQEPDLNTSLRVTQTQTAPKVYSHPKMEKLRDVIVNHFQMYQLKGEETRVMVFCQYRDTVVEVCHLLARLKPLVKVMSFVGQSTGKLNKGLSQKQQLLIMEKFRRGGYNTLVSTSIGEEGLDIGEVDLIVCYDAHASPIRLVQRMGRTGRKRNGRIVMLLTEGKENKKYQQSLCNKKSMNAGLINSKQFLKFLYTSPRMVPSDLEPECYKMSMSMPKTSRNRDVRKMLMNKKGGSSKNTGCRDFDMEDYDEDLPPDLLGETVYLHSMEAGEFLKWKPNPQKVDLSADIDWLLNDNDTVEVSRSSVSKDFQELLEFAARRRCDVPLTQTATLASQVCRNELWPSKKRKKRTGIHSKGPQKKKRNLEMPVAEPPEKKKKQRRLSNLWSAITETQDDFVTNDTELMPPPVIIPSKKKKMSSNMFSEGSDVLLQDTADVILNTDNKKDGDNDDDNDRLLADDPVLSPECCEEDAIDVLSDNLMLTEKMISKIRELEDGTVPCCRFSEMFRNSELSSFLIGHVQDVKVNKSISETHLPDSGYFDELLNPEVWMNFNQKSKNLNSESDKKGLLSPVLSSQRKKTKSWGNFIADELFSDHNDISNVVQMNPVNDSLLELKDNVKYLTKHNLNLEECDQQASSPKIPKIHKSQLISPGKLERKNWDSFISDDLFSNEDFFTDIDLKKTPKTSQLSSKSDEISLLKNNETLNKSQNVENELFVEIPRYNEKNHQTFDIGITQLMSISPDTAEDAARLVADEDFSCFQSDTVLTQKTELKKNTSPNKQIENDHQNQNDTKITLHIPSKKEKVKFVECNDPKIVDCNLSVLTQEMKEDSPKIQKSNDLGNLSAFVDEAILKWLDSSEVDAEFPSSQDRKESISEAPLSPIISSQRKVTVTAQKSFSTPKPKPVFSKHKKTNISNPSNNSSSHSSYPNDDNEISDDHSSLDDFEIAGTVKPKTNSSNKKKAKTKTKRNKNVEEQSRPGAGAVFIEDEAEESREDRRDSSDGENTSGLDDLDDSFVDDEETVAHDSVDIQAQYLQSVRSPGNRPGNFKIKEVQNCPGNIYSQALTEEELNEDYEQDSFCVSGSEEALSDHSEDDTLEIIEAALKKRRKTTFKSPDKKNNRKRIRVASSSSDEESDVLKNLQFTQVVKEPTSELNSSRENGKFAESSSGNTVNNSVEKNADLNGNIGENNDLPSHFWDDDECILINDDNFVDCAMKENTQRSVNSNATTSSFNKIIEIGDEPKDLSPVHISKNNQKSKNELKSTGVRKQLSFCKNNTNKKTLMTHFFSHSDFSDKETKKANPSTEKRIVPSSSKDSKDMKENGKYSSGGYCENFEDWKENESNSEEKMTVIASSRQVTSAPEIITTLKSRHRIHVLVHPIQVAHFIVSPQIGVIRITLKDFCGVSKTTPLMDTARNLKNLFQQAYMLVEHTPSESDQKGLWPVYCIDLPARLKTFGVRVLYSNSKASSADLLANLCCREFSCGRFIKLPVSVRDSTAVVQFLEATGVNTAVAFNACCSFKTMKDFLNSCKSVPEIRQILGVNREVARKIYYLLHDVL